MKRRSRCLPLVAACLLAHCVCAALEIPGADGSDGALRVTKESCVEGVYTIDLGQAATRLWDSTSPRSGKGVYDPEKWAVVFKYTSVQIDEGCTVKFVNHPSNPPVYWLVSGDVVIRGELNLDGERGRDKDDLAPTRCAQPGPGGFAGGLSQTYDSDTGYTYYGGGGYGPGGSVTSVYINSNVFTSSGASHATLGSYNKYGKVGALYGDETLIPLVGGSGGAGSNHASYDNFSMAGGSGGGAGGGAICIAASGTVTLEGLISARGNRGGIHISETSNYRYIAYFRGGCGSGGAVRLVAEAIQGSGCVDVCSFGGTVESMQQDGYDFDENDSFYDRCLGGAGRVRLDSNHITLCNRNFSGWNVEPSLGNGDQVVLWADAKITLLTLGGARLPADPVYRQSGYNECVSFATAGERELVFRTENIPTDANVVVKVTPRQSGKDFTGTTVPATMDAGGTFAQATWRAHIPLNDARTTFQVLVSTVPLNE